jgi:hypothetical protein
VGQLGDVPDEPEEDGHQDQAVRRCSRRRSRDEVEGLVQGVSVKYKEIGGKILT